MPATTFDLAGGHSKDAVVLTVDRRVLEWQVQSAAVSACREESPCIP